MYGTSFFFLRVVLFKQTKEAYYNCIPNSQAITETSLKIKFEREQLYRCISNLTPLFSYPLLV